MNFEPQIGVLCGKERTFSNELITRINENKKNRITAEFVKIGDIPLDYHCPYQLIVDRTAYKIPYYNSFLKTAMLSGTYVINDPFWFDTADRFFNFGLLSHIGVDVPKTVCLPSRAYEKYIANEDLGNMIFPLDWEKVLDYMGLPALMKPYNDLGWQNQVIVNSKDELIHHYNESGTAVMILQEIVKTDRSIRCLVVGKKEVMLHDYDPVNHQSKGDDLDIEPHLEIQLRSESLKISKILGYDMNAIEFAITDQGPVIVDFMNPVPALNVNSLTEKQFDWAVEKMADFSIECVKKHLSSYDHHHWYQEVKLQKHPRRKRQSSKE